MRLQRGFTLFELMVAMAIFAMLAVAGWQVFDSVSRARERAQFHADNLAALQYAYLQLQQDMGQIIPYQAMNSQALDTLTNNSGNRQDNIAIAEPFMSVDNTGVSFVRFADPDPRYQISPSVQHIEYIVADERLIRRQYTNLDTNSISLDSVLLEGVTAARWQVYLPEPSKKFPDNSNNIDNTAAAGQTANGTNLQRDIVLLPKGISISFTYQDMPITWQWALTPKPILAIPTNFGTNNPNGSNNGDNNNSSNNNDAANGTGENNNSRNAINNFSFGQ